jgi:hypothetical protein
VTQLQAARFLAAVCLQPLTAQIKWPSLPSPSISCKSWAEASWLIPSLYIPRAESQVSKNPGKRQFKNYKVKISAAPSARHCRTGSMGGSLSIGRKSAAV